MQKVFWHKKRVGGGRKEGGRDCWICELISGASDSDGLGNISAGYVAGAYEPNVLFSVFVRLLHCRVQHSILLVSLSSCHSSFATADVYSSISLTLGPR